MPIARSLWSFALCLCLLALAPRPSAHAQATPHLLPRYSLIASNGFDGMAMNAPAPPSATPPPKGNLKRGAYIMALGLGLVTGAVLNAAVFGSIRLCNSSRKITIASDAALAFTGLAFTLAGWGDFTLAPRPASLDTRTRRVGLPSTFTGASVFGFAAMSAVPLLACVGSGD